MSRQHLILLTGLALALAAALPVAAGRPSQGREAQVRVLHVGVDAPTVDVLVADAPVFPEIGYGELTSLRAVPLDGAGATFKVTLPGNPARVLAEETVALAAGEQATLAITGHGSALEVLRIEDGAPPTIDRGEQSGAVRLVHLSSDTPPLDMVAEPKGGIWSTGVGYRTAGPYTKVAVGDYDVTLRTTAGGQEVHHVPDLAITQYMAVSLVLYGTHVGDALDVLVIGGRAPVATGTPVPGRTPERTKTPSTGPGPGRTPRPTNTPSLSPGPNIGRTTLRALHGAAGLAPVDVLVDGLPLATDLAFAKVSDRAWQMSGAHTVTVVPSGASKPVLLELEIDLEQAAYDTLVLVSEGPDLVVHHVHDDVKPLITNGSSLRFVHASPDLPAVDVALATGDRLSTGATYFGPGAYRDVPAGRHAIDVRDARDRTFVLSVPDAAIIAGKTYSMYAIGSPADGSLTGLVIEDSVLPQRNPGPSGEAHLRLVHAVSGAPGVDFWIGGVTAVTDLAYRRVSDYLPFTSDNYGVRVAPAGQPGALAEAEVPLVRDTHYSLAFVGRPGDAELLRLTDDLSRPALGQARVRFAHLSPDAPDVDVAHAGGATLTTDLAYLSAGDYLGLDGGFVDLELREVGGGPVLLRVDDVWLKPGSVYTVFLMGLRADTLEVVVAREVEYPDGGEPPRAVGVAYLPVGHR